MGASTSSFQIRSTEPEKGSSFEIWMTTTMVITVRDGQIARLREFVSHLEALEAAGLSE